MSRTSSLLKQPLQPGLLRACPSCRRWFALKHLASRKDPSVGKVCTYRCNHCSKTVEYAQYFPPNAV